MSTLVSPARSRSPELVMSEPRISFSSGDFLDDDSYISISPNSSLDKDHEIDLIELELAAAQNSGEFEFLSSKNSFDGTHTMLTADELFFEGKLLPFSQIHHASQKLSKISLKSDDLSAKSPISGNAGAILLGREPSEPRIWFVDDDPSPRPPKCTVLWKELLRLRKHPRNSTLSPSSSSSSSSSSASSLGDAAAMEEKEKEQNMSSREKTIKRLKRGLERTRSATIRIRPMVNVPPPCTQKSSSLPPLFPLRKPRVDSYVFNWGITGTAWKNTGIVDGSWNCSNRTGGMGVVLLLDRKKWISLSSPLYAQSSLLTEFLALEQGLRCGVSLNLQHLELWTDSQEILDIFARQVPIQADCRDVKRSCDFLMGQLSYGRIIKVHRKLVQDAHVLAKQASRISFL